MATRLCCIANAWPPVAGHNAPRNCDAPGNSVRVMDCAGKAPAATALSHARAGRELLRTVARTKAAWRFPPQSRTPRANLKGWKPGVERPGSDTPGKRPHPPAPRRRCQKFPLEITTTTRRRSRRPTTRATRTRRRCSFSWGNALGRIRWPSHRDAMTLARSFQRRVIAAAGATPNRTAEVQPNLRLPFLQPIPVGIESSSPALPRQRSGYAV